MNKLTKSLAALALVAASGAANAGFVPATWTDSIDFNPDKYLTVGTTVSYSHNLTDTGFRPGVDYITNFVLGLGFADDSRRDGSETAFVDLAGSANDACYTTNIGDAFAGCSFSWSMGPAARASMPFTQAVFNLSNTGHLNVSITSLRGDFTLGSSWLMAGGASQVPEPGSLALLGLGLVGLGVAARRRKAA